MIELIIILIHNTHKLNSLPSQELTEAVPCPSCFVSRPYFTAEITLPLLFWFITRARA